MYGEAGERTEPGRRLTGLNPLIQVKRGPGEVRLRAVRALVAGILLLSAPLAGCAARSAPDPLEAPEPTGPRILAVVAHPDDETAFAASLFAAARFLDAAVDVVVVTDGEGGFKYSTPAEPLYGVELTDEAVGRAQLPSIRRGEMTGACLVLGVRGLHFLDQPDQRYTTDEHEVLSSDAWNLEAVREVIERLLAEGHYDYAFGLLPTAETHGHHKAATILLLQAVATLAPEDRPAVLGATVEREGELAEADPEGLEGWPVTRLLAGAEPQNFDRRRTFGYQDRLDWRIVVDWVIAEHKSQGTLQMMAGQGEREVFFLFEGGPPDAAERAAALFEDLAGITFEARAYGPSAGTNTAPARAR